MVQTLPIGEMMWSNNLNYEATNVESIGYVYEVDLKYPDSLKDKNKYFLFFVLKRWNPMKNGLVNKKF